MSEIMISPAVRPIYFVSDHTGLTAEALGKSLFTRFESLTFAYHTRAFIDTSDKADALVTEINLAAKNSGLRPILITTITDAELLSVLSHAEALTLDPFHSYLGILKEELGETPSNNVGRSHRIKDVRHYQMRMDAIDFALTTDDGLGTHHFPDADLILTGPSRTGKTPCCLYLAMQYGIRAANFPLADDDFEDSNLPELLLEHKDKLFGLIIEPGRLMQIRQGRKAHSRYASLAQCTFEVRQTERLYRYTRIPFFNVTSASVEEIASTILQRMGLAKRIH